jgi:hypothetical protein
MTFYYSYALYPKSHINYYRRQEYTFNFNIIKWSQENHKYFPIEFKQNILLFLMYLNRMDKKIKPPKVIFLLIMEFVDEIYFKDNIYNYSINM